MSPRFLAPALVCLAPAFVVADGTSAAERAMVEISRSETLESNVRALCDEIGPRMVGTEGARRAVDWALEAFEQAGVDWVRAEPFEVASTWREGKTRIEVLGDVRFEAEGVSTAWSPATSEGGIEAELIDAGTGAQGRIRRLGRQAKGKILLVTLHQVKTFFNLGVEQRDAILAMREAAEVSAAAIVFASTRPNRLLYRHIHTVTGEADPLPSVVVTREDALRMARLLESGKSLRMRISLTNQIGGPAQERNVVAEIRGSGRTQEWVLLGAHLDSWDLGTGCLDNAVNAALVIESARAIAASGERPRRTIRFVLFGAEEIGLFGSRAYVERHDDELDDLAAVVVHDMGLGEIEGYSLGGRSELREPLIAAMQALGGEADKHTTEAFFGSDHFDFLLEGAPTLVAVQDTSDYVLSYHSAADTYDKVSLSALRQRTRVAAVTILGLANLADRLGSRLSRGELETLMRSTGLDEQMKFLKLWESWKDGSRGRSK